MVYGSDPVSRSLQSYGLIKVKERSPSTVEDGLRDLHLSKVVLDSESIALSDRTLNRTLARSATISKFKTAIALKTSGRRPREWHHSIQNQKGFLTHPASSDLRPGLQSYDNRGSVSLPGGMWIKIYV